MDLWVLVVVDPQTYEVQARGPWSSEADANGAMRAYSKRLTSESEEIPYRLSAVGLIPMAYNPTKLEKVEKGVRDGFKPQDDLLLNLRTGKVLSATNDGELAEVSNISLPLVHLIAEVVNQ